MASPPKDGARIRPTRGARHSATRRLRGSRHGVRVRAPAEELHRLSGRTSRGSSGCPPSAAPFGDREVGRRAARLAMIPAMTTREAVLAPDADPAEAGFDAERLRRIDRHFDRYVDDGRLPGYLAVVARDGAIVHVASGGRRDLESGAPVEPDTIWRIYSMTKPITTVAAMMLFEEGAFQLTDPVARFIPAFADARVYLRGSAAEAADRARGRADAALAPHDPHVGADVRLPPHARRRRDLPRRTATSGARRRASTSPRAATRGRACRSRSSPGRSGCTRSRPTSSAGSSRSSRGSRSTRSSPSASSARWG